MVGENLTAFVAVDQLGDDCRFADAWATSDEKGRCRSVCEPIIYAVEEPAAAGKPLSFLSEKGAKVPWPGLPAPLPFRTLT